MVELQRGYSELQAAGVDLFVLSYDEADALADFAERHGIGYPMLSDPGSDVIASFGILNTLIPPDDHPWHGIPFPGTYVIDSNGIITHKFFESNLATRVGPDQLLAAARGDQAVVEARATPGDVEVAVTFTADELAVGVQHDIVASFRVPDGQHLYDEPTPDGLVAATIVIDEQPGLVIGAQRRPDSRVLDADEPDIRVHDGDVVLRRAIAHSGPRQDEMTITGSVMWQSCDANECGLVERKPFSFAVKLRSVVAPRNGSISGDEFFERMSTRRREGS